MYNCLEILNEKLKIKYIDVVVRCEVMSDPS